MKLFNHTSDVSLQDNIKFFLISEYVETRSDIKIVIYKCLDLEFRSHANDTHLKIFKTDILICEIWDSFIN